MMLRGQLLLQTQTLSPIIHLHPNPRTRKHHFQTLNTTATLRPPFSRVPNTTNPTVISDSGLLYRQKIIYLETNLNVNSATALQKNPNFRSTPISSLKSVENCLSSMGIERSAFGRIFDMHPQLLSCDPYSDLYSVFDFLLNEVCIPYRDVRKSIVRCPRLLVCSVDDQLRPTLLFLKKLGFVGQHSISCQTTVLLVSSVEGTLVPKIDYLESLGFTYAEVVWMVVRSPGLLTYSIENNFRPKVEFFLREIRGDLVELKRFPQYFSFSLERKIKPRHQILVEHGLVLSLADMLKVSDGEFNARLIEMRLRTHCDKQLLISPGILKEQMVNIG